MAAVLRLPHRHTHRSPCSPVDRPFFRRNGLPVGVVRSKRGWMLWCVSGRGWLAPLLSSLLSTDPRDVAVLGCCIVTARTSQGMARVRSGQAPAWPLSSDRSGRRGSRVKRDFACSSTRHLSPVLVVLRVTVTLEAGGTDTYTQRAIPGSEPQPGLLRAPSARCDLRSGAVDWPVTVGTIRSGGGSLQMPRHRIISLELEQLAPRCCVTYAAAPP